MGLLSYIVWDADPNIFQFGIFTLRWYGVLFASGFLIGQQIIFYIFRREGKKEKDVETLTVYLIISTILGARLGHVLFYEPEKYLPNPIDILKVWEGGLASHGAGIGIFLALYFYARQRKQSYLGVLDRIAIVVALTGGLIRLGNYMNSEIVGIPTESDYGVIFAHAPEQIISQGSLGITSVNASKDPDTKPIQNYKPIQFEIKFEDKGYNQENLQNYLNNNIKQVFTRYRFVSDHIYEPLDRKLDYTLESTPGGFVANIKTFGIPRHPAQLYESFSCFLIFVVLFYIWSRKKENTPDGLLFGIFLVTVFGLRFFYEFIKENQVDFEDSMALNMGQILSIPMVLVGVRLVIRVFRNAHQTQGTGS